MLTRTCSRIVRDQEETTSANMEARIAKMEQLIGKMTTKVGVLLEENKAIKDNIQEPVHDEEPSASEHHGSRHIDRGDNEHEDRKNMQDKLRNLKGKYKEMARKMGNSSPEDQLLLSTDQPYSAEVIAVPLLPKFQVPPWRCTTGFGTHSSISKLSRHT